MRILRKRRDEELLLGDARSFGGFYERHERAVLGFFMRQVGNPDVAADLLAETFAQVLERRNAFDPVRGNARSWLFGIARIVLLRSLDARRVERAARDRLAIERAELDELALKQIALAANEWTDEALGQLPLDQAKAVSGRVLEDKPYALLAQELGCSEIAARQKVSRGLAQLRLSVGGE